ncbi:MAG: multicopper oxidase family protein [Gemmatimonadetes bacterium]|nr:multicopper oxidase family protein [Gemmatimonadota bacterium]
MRPSQDLYCMELLPRPEVGAAGGSVELGRASSPFDVALTSGGAQRYTVTLDLIGLPPPESLGAFTTYVAWVAAPSLDPVRKLGEVRNGRTVLGEVSWDKFLIFVTAEASAGVTEQRGRMVLRGLSPSIRLQQHGMDVPAGAAAPDHAGHNMGDMSAGRPQWFMPPHRPQQRMVPMPGIDELVPSETPFLPLAGTDVSLLPEAKPRSVVRLADGDTLDLTASLVRRTINGRQLVMYAYNGQQPGPLLHVREGATIIVRFHNAIDLPSAVHWHGVRLENASDGAVGVTQDEVPVGGSFTYRVMFKDAGIYWYHPHVREDIQQDLGLTGNMLVAPRRPGAFGPAHREEVLMLDDILLGEGGLLPFGKEAPTHALMGRFGNVLLVNGDPRYALPARPGEVVRFFLTNVSNTRTFNLGFPGARMKLVGADIGRYEREEWVTHVSIAPAQRYIVDVRFGARGRYPLVNHVQAIDHMVGNFFPEVDTLGTVTVGGAPAAPDHGAAFARLRINRDVVDDIAAFRPWFVRAPDKELLLTLRLGELPYPLMQMIRKDAAYAHPVELSGTMPMMDWLATTKDVTWVLRDVATGRENMDVHWQFRLGEVVKIRIANDRTSLHPMPHPIHLHGQRFLVLSHNGVLRANLVWKDTVLLPVGDVVDVLVEMSNPGKWMMHCHIAEHLQSGMMGVFEVR